MTELKASLVLQLKNLLRGGIAQVRGELKGLKSEAQGLGSIKGPNADGLVRYGRSAREASQAVRELQRQQAALGGGGGGGATILASVGRTGLMIGGLGAAAFAAKRATDEAISFEYAMAQVKKKVDGAEDPATFRQIERDVKSMAQAFGIAQVEMAKLVAEAGASGVALKDLTAFMTFAAKASVGWDMLPAETAQVLAQIKAGSQMSMSEIGDLADMINYLGDTSSAKERDIVEMFQRSGEAARAAGSDTKTTLAFLTGSRAMGIGTEVGGRFFGAFTSKMVNPTKKGAEALKELGLSAEEVKKGMESAPYETMIKVLERLQRSARRAEFAKDLFGAEWFDEALRLAGGIKEVEKAYRGLQNTSNWRGSLNKGLQIELDTTKKNLDRVRALASDIADQFARWTLPGINGAIERLLDLMDRVRGQTAESKQKEASDSEMKRVSEYEASASEKDRGAAELRAAAKTTKNKSDRTTLLTRAANLEKEAKDLRERAELARETGRAFARTAQSGRNDVADQDEQQRLIKRRAELEAGMTVEGRFKTDAERRAHEEAGVRLRELQRLEAERKARENDAAQKLKAVERRKSGEGPNRAGLDRLQGILNQAKPGQDFVRDRESGVTWNVEKLRQEIERLKAKLGEVSGEADKAGSAVKDKLTLDLTAQGAQTAMSWAQGLRSGIPAVEAAAQDLRTPLMTPAAPMPGAGRPATGGGANTPARPANVQVGGIHIHGVQDAEKAVRLAETRLSGAIRNALTGAHHDGVA